MEAGEHTAIEIRPVDPTHPDVGLCFQAYFEAVGCGAVKHHPGEPSEIKRMWISSSARGHGLGRRMLQELEDVVARSGAREVPAFNDEPFADHWFEEELGGDELLDRVE